MSVSTAPEAPPTEVGGVSVRRFTRAWFTSIVPVPTMRGVWVAVSAVGLAMLLPTPIALWTTLVLVAALLAADAWTGLAPQHVGVARDHDVQVALDGTLELTWTVRNPSTRPTRMLVADELAPSLGAERRAFDVVVPGNGRIRQATTLHPSRRGLFTPTSITVRTIGPLGLAGRQHDREVPGHLEVHPAFRSRTQVAARLERSREVDVGLRSAKGRGSGGEFDQLRPYTPDDDHRRIDWLATARVGNPILRTYHAERNQHVVIVLDTGRTMAGLVEGVPRLDHGMDVVMGLTTVATALGDRVGLVAAGIGVRAVVPPSARRDQVRTITRAMYALEAELGEPSFRTAFAAAMARFRRRSLYVIVTDLSSEAVGDTLLPALPMLVRTHLVVVAAVRDPIVEHWALDRPEDRGAAFRAAAAATARRDREQVAARLRGMGVQVVDATPDVLAVRVVDHYLGIKASGAL